MVMDFKFGPNDSSSSSLLLFTSMWTLLHTVTLTFDHLWWQFSFKMTLTWWVDFFIESWWMIFTLHVWPLSHTVTLTFDLFPYVDPTIAQVGVGFPPDLHLVLPLRPWGDLEAANFWPRVLDLQRSKFQLDSAVAVVHGVPYNLAQKWKSQPQ